MDSLDHKRWLSAVLYVAAVALLLRFIELPLKPLHHDEGVNAYFLGTLLRDPAAYRYDPANYHGPTLFYFAWLNTFLFGVSTTALRLVPAVAGLLTVMLMLAARRHIGWRGALTAAACLALSPGAVYFSRYFIHEALLVCFTVGTVLALASWFRRGRGRDLILAGLSAGLATATKETTVISAGVLAIAAAATLVLMRPRLREGSLALRPSPMVMAQAVGMFLLVNVAFYTSFFTNWQGAVDAVRTFAFWTRTGTRDHAQAWSTYLQWLAAMEFPIAAAGLAGAVGALWRRDNAFAVFAGLWALGTVAAYSLIPYKTPWLTLNMIAPLALSAGYLVECGWQRYGERSPRVLQAVVVLSLAVLGYQAVQLNFVRYDDEGSPYVYAHTDRDVLNLVQRVRELDAENGGVTLAVLSQAQFPLSWYFRDLRAGYYGKVVVTKDPLVIVSSEQEFLFEMLAGERYTKVQTYRLRPGVRLTLYAGSHLKDRAGAPQS